jgi:UDP-N-acetylmuramate dehydrogenase
MSVHLPIRQNISLRSHNTFGVEAMAHAYLAVTDPSMLPAVRGDAALGSLPRLVLGGGSNILLTSDFPGLVLHMEFRGIAIVRQDRQATYIRVAAGESWHRLVLWTLAHGLGGLENLSLIPGSVGAAPIQNIGAYGTEIKDYIDSVTAFDFNTGNIFTLRRSECEFAYRDSIFKHRLRDHAVILELTLALPREWQPNTHYAELAQELRAREIPPTAQDISDAVIAIRQRKLPDPAVVGNAGSFFKNPLVPAAQRNALLQQHAKLVSYEQPDGCFKLAAGWLIDQCGWKGRCTGAAGVYEKQALVLVNCGGASGLEILQLAKTIQADVFSRFGVQLDVEPVLV